MFDYFVWLDGMIVLFVLLSFMGGIVMQVEVWLVELVCMQLWGCVGGMFDEIGQIVLLLGVVVIDLLVDMVVYDWFVDFMLYYVFDVVVCVVQVMWWMKVDFGWQVCMLDEFVVLCVLFECIECDMQVQIVVWVKQC